MPRVEDTLLLVRQDNLVQVPQHSLTPARQDAAQMASDARPAIVVDVRQPWKVAVLTAVTFSIYGLVWYYKINREMRDFGATHGDSRLTRVRPWWSVIAIVIGGLLVIPAVVSYVRTVRRVQAVECATLGQTRTGAALIALLVASSVLGVAAQAAGLVLSLLGLACFITAIALIQARLNAAWRHSLELATV